MTTLRKKEPSCFNRCVYFFIKTESFVITSSATSLSDPVRTRGRGESKRWGGANCMVHLIKLMMKRALCRGRVSDPTVCLASGAFVSTVIHVHRHCQSIILRRTLGEDLP